jgi:pimeloyl-ACP methyl ester carboxylesterase
VPVLKSFAGGRLFGGGWGSGVPTVLALHGWQRTHGDFAPVFGDSGSGTGVGIGVGPGVSAIAPDLFGFGATPAPPEAWGSDEYAHHLLPLFDEPAVLGDRVVVVGHSFGGRVAVRLQRLVPDRIERMVLCGVPLLGRDGPPARTAPAYRMVRRLHRMGLIGDRRMEAAKNRYGSADYRAAQGVIRDVLVRLLAEDYTDDMASIGCPVDLVWGEEDIEVPLEVAERAQRMMAEARLHVLPGVGHLVPTEAPRELLRVILGPAVEGPSPGAVDGGPMAGTS